MIMSLSSLAQSIISFVDLLVWVLSSLAIVIFFIGLVRYIAHGADSHAHQQARESIMWSLVALFVLFSIWGILQLLTATFFGNIPL